MDSYKYFMWAITTIRDILKFNEVAEFPDEFVKLIIKEIDLLEEKEENYSIEDFEKFHLKIVEFDTYISTLPNTKKFMDEQIRIGFNEGEKMKIFDCQCKICGRLRVLNNLGQCGMCEEEQKCKAIEPEFIDMLKKEIADKDNVIQQQDNKIDLLKEALQEVIDFTPNDTDFPDKPTRDECIEEIKYFARAALEEEEKAGE